MPVGRRLYGVGGDADGDGDAGNTTAELAALGGVDNAHLGGGESFVLLIDVDQDGTFDVAAGVALGASVSGYAVAHFAGSPLVPALGFGLTLPDHTGTLFASPTAAAPDLEFTITAFHGLPASSGADADAEISINVFAGSFDDAGIGEDFLPGIEVPIDVCGADNPCEPAPDPPPICDPVDPGAYCGGVPAVGWCDGHTLHRCDSGVATTTDCAAAGGACGWDSTGMGGVGYFGCVEQDDTCAGISDAGQCNGNTVEWCDTDTLVPHAYDCGLENLSCGWTGEFYCCHEAAACVPLCQGKGCGDDGCGGSCGTCGDNETCSDSGHCLECSADDPLGAGGGPITVDEPKAGCTATPAGTPAAALLLLIGLLALALRRREAL